VRDKLNFVGFLQRNALQMDRAQYQPSGDYILVTTGGGGDGADLVEDVLRAYRHDAGLTHRALIVLGPYMPQGERTKLTQEAAKIPYVEVIEFDSRMEDLVAGAKAVVAMGGYNTYCEILSFDKPALIVPRVQPREEQLIRATRAAELGLIDMLLPEESADPARLAAVLKTLPECRPPSSGNPELRLEGLRNIARIVGEELSARELTPPSVA
jgi:predicted glycosyltransferase